MDTITERSFCLNETNQVWILHDGCVDLFVETDKTGGSRRHLHRLMPGDAMFGLNRPHQAHEPRLLAVPSLDAELHAMAQAHWQALLEKPSLRNNFADWLDGWIVGLSSSLSAERPPKKASALSAGETLQLAAESEWFAPGQVFWVEPQDRSMRWFDITLEPGLFPLSPSNWLTATAASSLRCDGPTASVEPRQAYMALAEFHRLVLAALEDAIATQHLEGMERLRQREAQDIQVMEGAVARLAGVLRPGAPLADSEGLTEKQRQLLGACNRVLAASGIAHRAPKHMPLESAAGLAAIAKEANAMTRQVTLVGPRWWERDHAPLLAYWKDTDEPVAMVPHAGGYRIYDSSGAEPIKVDAAIAARLSSTAVMFFRAFPPRAIALKDLLRFGVVGCEADLKRLVVLGLIGSVLGVLVPYGTGLLIDSVIPSGEQSRLFQIALALAVVALSLAVLEFVRSLALLRIEGRMGASTHAAMVERMMRLPAKFFRDYSAGDLAQRAFGIDAILQLFSNASQIAVLQGVFSIASLCYLFVLNPPMAWLATGLAVFALLLTTLINLRRLAYERQMFDVDGRISGKVVQLLMGIPKLRVAGAEGRGFAQWAKAFAEKKRLTLQTQRLANHLLVFDSAYPTLALLAIFWYLSRHRAALSTGEFLAFNAAFIQFLGAMLGMGTALTMLLNAVPLYERSRPILHAMPESVSAVVETPELLGGIELARVSFKYTPDGPLVLQELDVQISPGEFVAFVGPSGSGKSTVFRLLLGFDSPSSGAVFFDGQDLCGLDARSVRQQIGVVLQQGTLLPGDIFTNIVGSSSLTLDDAWAAARQAGLEEDIEALPMGMHTFIAEGGGNLSGGQLQRLLIARALAGKPRILLFDEATSALDNVTQEAVARNLERINATRVVIAHRLSTVRKADRIFVLEGGRVVESGNFDKLMKANGRFAELARRQMSGEGPAST
jgi:NHLM bacteriocin system ABC transporter ATP-binding protein